jgi:hypothetical protein
MTIVAFLRGLLRRLLPPGNRASLDTEYRQPNAPTPGDPGRTQSPSGHVPGGYMQN